MNKYFLVLMLVGILLVFAFPIISARIYKQNSIIDLRIPCSYNGSFCAASTPCNITIEYPNSSIFIDNELMTNTGNGMPNYTLPNSAILGIYPFNVACCQAGECDTYSDDLEISYRGEEKLGSGEGLSIFISVVVILVIGIFFFLISLAFKGNIGKIICIGLAGIVFLIATLYSIIILTQNFGGFATLTEGFTTFWFVIRIITTITLTFFTLYCIMVVVKWWKVKRGLIDID